MKKRALAIILALCMVISMMPVTALAAPMQKQTAQIQAFPEVKDIQALPELPAQPDAGDYSISVSVVAGSSHGEVELSASSADAQESVYLLANPDDGYVVELGGSYEYYYYALEVYYIGMDIYEVIMPDGDVNLEVSFVKAEGSNHKVNVSVNNKSGGTAVASRSSAKQGESIILEVTVNTGYVLDAVYATDANGDNANGGYLGTIDGKEVFEIIMPATALNLSVEFVREQPHTIKVNNQDPTRGTAYTDKTEAYTGEEFILTVIPAEGYEIFYIDCRMYPEVVPLAKIGENQWKGVMPNGNVTIDVTFTPSVRSVSVAVENNLGGTASVDKTEAKLGETVTLTCVPDEGYKVAAITGVDDIVDNGDNTYTFTMPAHDVALKVTFKTIYNPVIVVVDTGLGGTAFADVAEAKEGDTVTLTCAPEEGYRVALITGAEVVDNGDGTYTFVMPDEAVEIHVLFLRENNPFLDVNETHFFYDPVLWAVENGITNGIDETHFGPFVACNRAAVVTFLWRAAGSPAPETTENPFDDVPEDVFYYDAVLWAVENGITNGLTETTFGPGETCNRAQVVTFLHRAKGCPAPETTENPFSDVPEDSFYYSAVLWALENGVTTGATATTFDPNGQCLRAHVVTFLYRAAQIPEPEPEPTEPTEPEPTDPEPTDPTDPADPEPTDPTDPVEYYFDLRSNGYGTVSYADGFYAAAGESIFFYAVPDDGYYLERVEIFNPDNEIDISKILVYGYEDNLYELVMIDHDIIMTCVFSPIE